MSTCSISSEVDPPDQAMVSARVPCPLSTSTQQLEPYEKHERIKQLIYECFDILASLK